MFPFLSKKPFLSDLIPDNYVDIHSHLLPGIDDGSKNMADTLSLVTALQKLGFEQFITTPHVMKNVWENTKTGIENQLHLTKEALGDGIARPIPFQAAAEYLMDADFMTLFQNEPLLVLKDNYVLVEMSYMNPPIQLQTILFELQVAGYQPVLAHPERYSFYHQNFNEYVKLKESGCLFQLNLLSTVGYYGAEIAATSKQLLKKGMIDFVGSDVHHQNHIKHLSKKTIFKDVQPLKEAIAHNQLFRF